MSDKVPLAALPVPSTSFLSDAVFEHPGGEACLKFDFSREGTTAQAVPLK